MGVICSPARAPIIAIFVVRISPALLARCRAFTVQSFDVNFSRRDLISEKEGVVALSAMTSTGG